MARYTDRKVSGSNPEQFFDVFMHVFFYLMVTVLMKHLDCACFSCLAFALHLLS